MGPKRFRRIDIPLLMFLGAATEQYDPVLAASAKVNTIAGTKIDNSLIDNSLTHAGAHALGIGEIACPDLRQRSRDFQCGRCVQAIEPSPEGARPIVFDVFNNSHRILT